MDPPGAVPVADPVPVVEPVDDPFVDELPVVVPDEDVCPGLVELPGVVEVPAPDDPVEPVEDVLDEDAVVDVVLGVVDEPSVGVAAVSAGALRLAPPPLIPIATPPVARTLTLVVVVVVVVVEVVPASGPAVPVDAVFDWADAVPVTDRTGRMIAGEETGPVASELAVEAGTNAGADGRFGALATACARA